MCAFYANLKVRSMCLENTKYLRLISANCEQKPLLELFSVEQPTSFFVVFVLIHLKA